MKPIVQYINVTKLDRSAPYAHMVGEKTNKIYVVLEFSRGEYILTVTPVGEVEIAGVKEYFATPYTTIRVPVYEAKRNTPKQRAFAVTFAGLALIEVLRVCERKFGTEYEWPEDIFPGEKKLPIIKGLAPAKTPREALVTEDILRKFWTHRPAVEECKGDNATVLAKYTGGRSFTFLVVGAEHKGDDDWLLYGKCNYGHGWKWGYTMLSTLEHQRFYDYPFMNTGVELDKNIPDDATVAELSA